MNAAPVVAQHRGKQVVCGRKHVSPHLLRIPGTDAVKLLESFPTAGDTADWLQAAVTKLNGKFGMALNDKLGDCTIADGPVHCTTVWTANNGDPVVPSDDLALKAYETVDGYVDGDPSTDQGGVETNVLAAWQQGIDGFAKLDLWIPISTTNVEHFLTGVERYGCVYSGVALPLSAQNQAVWQYDESDPAAAVPGSWGGHAVSWSKYSRAVEQASCVTWGMEQGASFTWLGAYMDEAYIPFCSTLWCPNGKSPFGDTVAVLKGNLPSLGN